MNSKAWTYKVLALCLNVAILATYTSVALAAPGKAIGDLTVAGKAVNGEAASVRVNGEMAQSGRTIFSASTISTPESASATINLGKYGRIELAPNSSISLNGTDSEVVGNLTAGTVTSLTNGLVSVTTPDGKTARLAAGASAMAGAGRADDEKDANGKCIDKDNDGVLECEEGTVWWLWTLAFGGAAAGIIFAAMNDNNRVDLGGGTVVTSPNR